MGVYLDSKVDKSLGRNRLRLFHIHYLAQASAYSYQPKCLAPRVLIRVVIEEPLCKDQKGGLEIGIHLYSGRTRDNVCSWGLSECGNMHPAIPGMLAIDLSKGTL